MNNKYFHILIFVTFLVSFTGLTSCLKDTAKDEREEEQRLLKEYIARNNITVSPTKSGLYYLEVEEGYGNTPQGNDWVEFSFTARLLVNDKVVITTDSAIAAENGIYNEHLLYGPNRAQASSIYIRGLREGLGLMKQGGKATLIVPSSLAFGYIKLENIPAFSTLIIDVELHYVISNIAQFERNRLNEYLTANSISLADSTESGLYYIQILEGFGDEYPGVGKIVKIFYKGSYLNGKVFDETGSENYYMFTIGYNQVIKGIEEGVRLMKKGGKARLIIPYYLAFGEAGYTSPIYGPIIWPYSTVIYDIDLVDF